MTIDEFMTALEESGGLWHRVPLFGAIRERNTGCCPITFLAWVSDAKSRPPLNLSCYYLAGEELGLSVSDADKIVNAADGIGGRSPEGVIGPLRDRMLKLVSD